jgi:hypothetical protein
MSTETRRGQARRNLRDGLRGEEPRHYAKRPPIRSDASRWKSTLASPSVSTARNLGSHFV